MTWILRGLLIAAWSILAAHAQTTFATITGTVTDPNGLAVQGSAVDATNLATNYRYTAKSNEAGVYTGSHERIPLGPGLQRQQSVAGAERTRFRQTGCLTGLAPG